jgi:hypothetical protein
MSSRISIAPSPCAGVSIKGSARHRNADTIGIAGIVNGISATREQYCGRLRNAATSRVFYKIVAQTGQANLWHRLGR